MTPTETINTFGSEELTKGGRHCFDFIDFLNKLISKKKYLFKENKDFIKCLLSKYKEFKDWFCSADGIGLRKEFYDKSRTVLVSE